jgi:Transposase, Mutator family
MSDVRRLPVGEERQATSALDELAREGARRMIAAAPDAEVQEYVASFTDELDEDGHRLVVRNGHGKERRVTVGSGTVPVKAPRVNDKRVDEQTAQQIRFSSRILPAYARRSPKVSEVLPILYLRELSTGDFRPALEGLLGEDAGGSPRARSAGCARNGSQSASASVSAGWASPATPTCSSTACTSRSAWVRTITSACSS